MLKAVIKKNNYQDSVVLMSLASKIRAMEGINNAEIAMATPANKEIMTANGLYTPELDDAKANDMVIVLDTENDMDAIVAEIEAALKGNNDEKAAGEEVARSWKQATEMMPEANIAMLSIPGTYAALEADKALDNGLHVFMFSDNVAMEDEVALKQKAHEKGLLVMGPDCGTAIINGVPLAFANRVRTGNIGVIGASGTGLQEVTVLIDHYGSGISTAVGTGGRDLAEANGAVTMVDAIIALENDPMTKVITVISKPPGEKSMKKVVDTLNAVTKPVVVAFLGNKPTEHIDNIHYAYTLEEAAQLSVKLEKQESAVYEPSAPLVTNVTLKENQKFIKGLYSGGTLAYEAGMLMQDAMAVKGEKKADGVQFERDGHIVIDLGDDAYTQGKPHPMIDPENRVRMISEAGADASTAVILFDIELGYGGADDMITPMLSAVAAARDNAAKLGQEVVVVCALVGTQADGYTPAKEQLEAANILVAQSNVGATLTALNVLGQTVDFPEKSLVLKNNEKITLPEASSMVLSLLGSKPKVINVGLKSFGGPITEHDGKVLQFDWKPVAGGDLELQKVLHFLGTNEIDEANETLSERIANGAPYLLDVVPAYTVIPELKEKVLLHAGPPIKYENMSSPIKGSCVGAILFEGWATDEPAARAMLENGEITFIPCHHVKAVGPMGGITSMNMPVFIVENRTDGNHAYCTMNEGIGAVLRFGAYGPDVVTKLKWMKDTLAPVLSKAIRTVKDGMDVSIMVSKAIAMGDEFHQRNIAASALFLREMAPIIADLDIDNTERKEVLTFLAETDQFFLNIMMASCKAIMDGARKHEEGTVVTAMCRNGENFGIRIAGMGDEWFTGPANTPDGLYFAGYSTEDAAPDMGDSAITETFGVGGVSMIAAPAVTRFVGSGGFNDALNYSNEMMEIFINHNNKLPIPTWDFKGVPLAMDARKVVETGVLPVINTGIAHKEAGKGQIGAGTVYPPIEAFEKAVKAYAEKLGYK